jgi:multimeric flavodoxin WrbA
VKVLVINGSPRGEGSATMKLTRAFLEGAGWTDAEIIDISKLDVKGCLGCFGCWAKTPGKCVIDDDMSGILPKLIEANVIIWSFPLYCNNVPGQMKIFIDRRLPLALPYMDKNAESGGHPSRYDFSGQRHFLISTCGFWTAKGNYDSVSSMFGGAGGDFGHEIIFCGQGELFNEAELKEHTGPYLDIVRRAGSEYVAGDISDETHELLAQPLLPREVFEKMADESWGS